MPKLHIRVDDEELNVNSRYACGIAYPLPEGDKMFFEEETHRRAGAYFCTHPEMDACPGCFPSGKPQFGTPISQLSGRPGEPGYGEFCRIARSWGHE